MKNIIIILLVLFSSASCKKSLESLNVNVKNATEAGAGTFFTSAQVNLVNRLNNVGLSQPPFVFFAQYLTEVTYVELSNYFVGNTNGSDLLWRDIYQRVIKNLDESRKVLENTEVIGSTDEIKKQNQLLIIEIMRAYTYGILVDIYGNVPFSEAMDIDNVLPKYDDGKEIYFTLIDILSNAIENLNPTIGSFGNNDVIYSGNVDKWKKFGNSLKLKLGMRIIDEEFDVGKKAVVESAKGVFQSNGDNAVIKYQSTTPNTHPFWVHLVQNNLRYYVGTNTIVDIMNSLNDPRREAYFSKVGSEFIGGEPGRVQSFDLSSHLSDKFYDPTLEAILTDYASVEFLIAEGIERNILNDLGTAEEHYNSAIKASFDYYGVNGFDNYIIQNTISYNTASGSWQEKIGTQKWIALFNQGFEGWTEYRRLDFPKLEAPANAFVTTVPVRLIYPVSEQSLNSENYERASSEIGGDLLTTRIFWDKF